MKHQYVITIKYDGEAKVYIGTCDEVRGLVVEASSIEEVVEIAQDLLPDMVAANVKYDMENGLPPLFQLANYAETRTS